MVAEMASFIFELSQLGDAVREKTGLCGKNSQSGGGGSDPNPLLDV